MSVDAARAKPTPSRQNVGQMFDRIAHRYDLANRVLSMGTDIGWRKRMARDLPDRSEMHLLDMATGTGDVLLAMHRMNSGVRYGTGMDIAGNMLAIGRDKIEDRGLAASFRMVRADATCIGARDDFFDAVTISFGIRNVPDVPVALREMHRVLKPGGRLLVLEFSLPPNALFRPVYLFYLRHILPRIGGFLSGDPSAYRYLNQTIETFPYGDDFCALMRDAGFREVAARPLTMGIATLYRGDK